MKTGPHLRVSSDRLVKPEIEPATPGLQGKWLIYCSTAGPDPDQADLTSALIIVYYVRL